jgi:glycosyltransferase involved in cell wall biosynthesis
MKICFVAQEYPPGDFGGIGRFTSDLATGMAALGHEVHVVTRGPGADRVDCADGVWLHRLGPPERPVPELDGVPLAGNLCHSANVYRAVCRIHAAAPLDVVSAPLWAYEGMTCSLDDRFPTVLSLMTSLKTLAGMHPSWSRGEAVCQLLALEGITARRATALHAISHAILEKVRHDTGARDVPAAVVPLGARDRTADYPPGRSADGKVRVLCVGRLERRKGTDVLLEAAVELLSRHPQVELILAGKETTNTEIGTTYPAAFVARHGANPTLAGRVTFAGLVSDEQLYRLYAGADVVCLPSRYESFGLVLVEGMMFGKPVVGCAVGGMCEIVEPGGNGFLAAPGDAVSLTECLERLIENEALRREFGRRSRTLYEQKYAMPRVVADTLRYYGEVAARHRATAGAAAGGRVAERLAEVIAEAGGVSHERAAEAVARLLGPPHFPKDCAPPVSDRTAPPSPAEQAAAGPGVEGGQMSQDKVVAAPPRGRLGRLRALLSPRMVLRYVKRLISLPWNFQQCFDEARAFQKALPQQLAQVRQDVETLLGWQEQRLMAALERQAQQLTAHEQWLKTTLERQEQRLKDTTDDVVKDVRQLRYRFAEFYGALVEELRQLRVERQGLTEAPAEEKPGRGRAA